MSLHEGSPPLSSYRGSALRWSEAHIERTTAQLGALGAGVLGRSEVLAALEQLVERLSECLPRERSSHRCLPHLAAKGSYRLAMGPREGLQCPTPVGQVAILPDGSMVTGSLGGYLTRWTKEASGPEWRSKILHRGDDAAPHFDFDPRLGFVHTLDDLKVVLGAPCPKLQWVCSPVTTLQEPVRAVEVLADGSIAILGMRQLSIATRQSDGSWATEEHGVLGNLRAACVLPSGWIFIGDDNRTGVFHRDWPGGAALRKEIGRRGEDVLGGSISALRVLSDSTVSVGRRSGGVGIIEQGRSGEWRERMLSAAGAPVIGLQSILTGGLVSLRSNGEVSLWTPDDGGKAAAGYFQFSGAAGAGIWRERRLLTWEAVRAELGTEDFFFTDGRITPDGTIYLAGSVRRVGAVLVFDGDGIVTEAGREVVPL